MASCLFITQALDSSDTIQITYFLRRLFLSYLRFNRFLIIFPHNTLDLFRLIYYHNIITETLLWQTYLNIAYLVSVLVI